MPQSSFKIADGYVIGRYASIFTSSPSGSEPGIVTRNIPGGVQTVTEAATTLGTPQLVNSSGTTIVHTPASGKRIRLKWFAMASPDSNTTMTIVTVTLADNNIYIWPMGSPGAFMHSSIREGSEDGLLTVNLSSAQDIYVNMDIEEF